MLAPITRNEKPAARTNRDGLILVFQTTPLTSRKGSRYDLLHHDVFFV